MTAEAHRHMVLLRTKCFARGYSLPATRLIRTACRLEPFTAKEEQFPSRSSEPHLILYLTDGKDCQFGVRFVYFQERYELMRRPGQSGARCRETEAWRIDSDFFLDETTEDMRELFERVFSQGAGIGKKDLQQALAAISRLELSRSEIESLVGGWAETVADTKTTTVYVRGGNTVEIRFDGDCVDRVLLDGKVVDQSSCPAEGASPDGENDNTEDVRRNENTARTDTDVGE